MALTKGRSWIGVVLVVVTVLLIGHAARHTSSLPESLTWLSDSVIPVSFTSNSTTSDESKSDQKPQAESGRRVAFATFLAESTKSNKQVPDNENGYFVSARVLAYQLLHNPATKNNASIDFIVLVTKEVNESKRKRLGQDGAIVKEVEDLESPWLNTDTERYSDQLTKLRLFELTGYDLICFIDADHAVFDSLEGIFDDVATQEQNTRDKPTPGATPENMLESEEPVLPKTYVLAGHGDGGGDHTYPPEERDYFNMGFVVFRPDPLLFTYYQQLMSGQNEGLFRTQFREQDLMNFAHRRDKGGRMPWQQMWYGWNINAGNERDYEMGVHSVHGKFWINGMENGYLTETWKEQRGEMYGFWKGREEAKS